MSRGTKAEAVAAVLLGALVVGLGTASTDLQSSVPDFRSSTLVNDRPGLRALYLTLQGLGVPVERSLRPVSPADPVDATWIAAAPSQPWVPAEIDDLKDWVERGGRLVAFASSGLLTHHDSLLKGLGFTTVGRRTGADHVTPTSAWQGYDDLEFLPWAAHLTLEGQPNDPRAGDVDVVLASERGPLAVRFPFGQGEVLLVSDLVGMNNESLGWNDNDAIALSLLLGSRGTDARLVFDEFHHGFREEGSRFGLAAAVLGTLTGSWPGRALLVLVAAGGVFLLGAAVRLGAPDPDPPAEGRALSEHADALGQLLESARAGGEALRILAAGVRRVVGPRVGLPPGLPAAEFRRRLGASTAPGATQLADALAAAELQSPRSAAQVARTARELARARWRFMHGRG